MFESVATARPSPRRRKAGALLLALVFVGAAASAVGLAGSQLVTELAEGPPIDVRLDEPMERERLGAPAAPAAVRRGVEDPGGEQEAPPEEAPTPTEAPSEPDGAASETADISNGMGKGPLGHPDGDPDGQPEGALDGEGAGGGGGGGGGGGAAMSSMKVTSTTASSATSSTIWRPAKSRAEKAEPMRITERMRAPVWRRRFAFRFLPTVSNKARSFEGDQPSRSDRPLYEDSTRLHRERSTTHRGDSFQRSEKRGRSATRRHDLHERGGGRTGAHERSAAVTPRGGSG